MSNDPPEHELSLMLPDTPPKCPGSFPLTVTDIDVMLFGFELNGSILAVQARIAGMKARNLVNAISGHSPEYSQRCFQDEADNITAYASQLRAMRAARIQDRKDI